MNIISPQAFFLPMTIAGIPCCNTLYMHEGCTTVTVQYRTLFTLPSQTHLLHEAHQITIRIINPAAAMGEDMLKPVVEEICCKEIQASSCFTQSPENQNCIETNPKDTLVIHSSTKSMEEIIKNINHTHNHVNTIPFLYTIWHASEN